MNGQSNNGRRIGRAGGAAGFTGLGLVLYWLALAFVPLELGHLTAEQSSTAREAIAGVAGTSGSALAGYLLAWLRELL